MAQGTRWVGLDAARVSALVAVEASNDGLVKGEAAGRLPIVLGLDQHRAQITAEWVDSETGEITRSRIGPAHRQGVRQFCEKFRGQEVEVARSKCVAYEPWHLLVNS